MDELYLLELVEDEVTSLSCQFAYRRNEYKNGIYKIVYLLSRICKWR